jgi:molecular chaperone GrpE
MPGTGDKQSAKKIKIEPKHEQELAQLKEQLAEKDAAHRRALADYINLQNRSEDQSKKRVQMGVAQFVAGLLEPLKNVEMAYQHSQDQVMGLVMKQIKQVLEQEGVKEIGKVGEEYNADTMEVVETKEGEQGKVLEVLEKGYIFDWIVIKPARVVVGRAQT